MSKAFRFPLQKILDYRETMQETHEIKLKKSQMNLIEQQTRLESLYFTKDHFLQEQERADNPCPVNINNLQIAEAYVVQLNKQIVQQKNQVVKSTRQVETDRQELLEVTKDKKIVEKLKERQSQEYHKEMIKKERMIESEIALRIASSTNPEGEAA